MKFDDLVKAGQLKKETTGKDKLIEFIDFAENEIDAAKFNYPKFKLVAYKAAYDALIHAGNALIRYYDYRPTHNYTHATITECVDRILGKKYGELVSRFKSMRRKRHPLQYEAKFLASSEEVKKSIEEARLLIKKIEEHIEVRPSKRLF